MVEIEYVWQQLNERPILTFEEIMNFLFEIIRFLTHRRKLWLLPIILFVLVFGGLLLLTQGTVVAPFIYTVF